MREKDQELQQSLRKIAKLEKQLEQCYQEVRMQRAKVDEIPMLEKQLAEARQR